MSLNYGRIMNIAWNIVQEVGIIIAKRSAKGRQPYVTKTNDADLVTATDKEVEQIIMCKLLEHFPDHKLIGEERASEGGNKKLSNDPTWLIDPIDGTLNFIHNFPHCCISIALLVDKIPVIGIIHNPVIRQKFTAIKGKGAYYNDCHICVSGEKRISHALFVNEFYIRKSGNQVEQNFWNTACKSHGMRSLGSAALNLAMVAMGGADATWIMGIHHWDVAAGIVLVEEAGGVVMDPVGGPYDLMARRILAASSRELACDLSKILMQVYAEPRDQ